MKAILFPTDFSENANYAAMFAAEIANKSKAQLFLFHAFWVPIYESDILSEVKIKESEAQVGALKGLLRLENKIKNSYPNVSISILTSNGFTADAIVSAAKEKQVDLIVMGTKGASGIKEVIMGSNTVDVIAKAVCPVLAIPEMAKTVKFDKFVFASNFSEHDTEEISFLIELGKLFDSQIVITHVSEDDFIIETADQVILEKMKSDVKEKTQYKKLKYKLLKGNVIGELNNYILENNVDLLSMVTTKKHFLSKVFNRSFTQKMAFHTSVPLLVLHGPADDAVL